MNSLNLNIIDELHKKFKTKIGYSDHSEGYEASLMAVALGGRILEKHFTLNKKSKGPDHKASLSPNQFIQYVNKIRCKIFIRWRRDRL